MDCKTGPFICGSLLKEQKFFRIRQRRPTIYVSPVVGDFFMMVFA